MNLRHSRPALSWLLPAALLFLAVAAFYLTRPPWPAIDPGDRALVATGKQVYEQRCAACHGADLSGQPDWRERQPNGRMPAPPHDASGHTWHHPDALLFGIVKDGMVPGKYAPPNYQSDMPAFAGILSDDEIRAALAYIKSIWPERQLSYQRQIDRDSPEGRAGR